MVTFIFVLLSLATVAELIFSAVFLQLYLQRRKAIYLYFSIFTGIAIFWSLGTAIMLFANTSPVIYGGYWLFLVAPMLSTLFILYFCQQFIKGKISVGYALGVIAIIAYAAILAASNDLLTIQTGAEGLNKLYPNRVFYIVYGLYFIVYFDISIFVLRQHRKEHDKIKYYQAKNIVYGTGLTGTLGIFTNILLPALGVTQYVWVGPLFSLIFLSFSGVAIARYKLLDIKGTILRSTSYIFTLLVLLAVYSVAIVAAFGTTVLRRDVELWQWGALSLATVVVASLFTPVQRYFNRQSARFFFRNSYNSSDLLNELNSFLVSSIEVDAILKNTSFMIQHYLKPEYVSFIIYESDSTKKHIFTTRDDSTERALDKKAIYDLSKKFPQGLTTISGNDSVSDQLKSHAVAVDIELVATLTSTADVTRSVGSIILGSKKNGSLYSSQDIEVIRIISDELVIAIQNALSFEEIQQFNVTLQQKIDDATHQLKLANDKLVELNDNKDDFISMASHQLRTPLTAVKGNISMIMDGDFGKVPSTVKDPLGQAYASSERMVGLIADLLNVSRLKTGKFAIQPVPSNLDTVVKSELKQLQEAAKSHKLTLTYHAPKSFPTLMLDEIKIRQVIMNFIDNAIYYTPGGGHIDVTLKHTPQTIEFTVVDDGIGVPRHLQKNLFTKFYRADNAQKMRPDGTGIGLFMAKKVIIASGGSLIFKSIEGKGSTFGFTIPLAKLQSTPVTSSEATPVEAQPQ